MGQVLALVSAALYGVADFSGGTAARRLGVWRVTAWSQLFGVAVLLLGFLAIPVVRVTASDLAFGVAAGVFGIIGLVILYSALAGGTMSLIAPISGATAAAVPVLFDVLSGGVLTRRQWLGVGLAACAVLLIGSERSGGATSRVLSGRAIVAGILFGMFFIMFSRTSPDSGLWPLAAARAATIPVAFAGAAIAGGMGRPTGRDPGLLALLGSLDMAANVAVAVALQRGPLGAVAVLSSLYPAFTAVTAIVAHRERPDPRQSVGVLLALGAIVALML